MTLIDKTPKGQNEFLSYEIELPHSPKKVWRAITDPELLAEWLLPSVGFRLEPGTRFTFQVPPMPEWDGVIEAEVAEIELLRRFSYQMKVGDFETLVTFTLTPTADGTVLSILHTGFRSDQKQNFGGAKYGWKYNSGRLVELLNTLE